MYLSVPVSAYLSVCLSLTYLFKTKLLVAAGFHLGVPGSNPTGVTYTESNVSG